MKRILLFLIFVALFQRIFATEQVPDILLIGNDTIYLKTFPLESIELKYRPFGLTRATAPHTGCWRGYHAVWRLKNDSLYLEKILNCQWQAKSEEENIIELFKKNSLEKYIMDGKIFATWYDKILFNPPPAMAKFYKGRIYIYEVTYKEPEEKDIIMKFVKGILIINRLKG